MEISEEQKKEITRLHGLGISIKNLTQLTGVENNSLRVFLNENNLKRNYSWDTKKLRIVADYLKSGKKITEVSDILNLSLSQINRVISIYKLREW